MKTFIKLCIGFWILTVGFLYALDNVKIHSIQGVVKVRQGLEETWYPAAAGMLLKPIDTILTLEGEAVIILPDGIRFRLGSHTILDISDLRKITKREMFLFLMSEKVNRLPRLEGGTELQIGNVSVVHGTSQKVRKINEDSTQAKNWIRVFNGAKTLYHHGFYPNTIMKLHKAVEAYSQLSLNGETYFYLGQSFEKLNESGHAMDAYQTALDKADSSSDLYWVDAARKSLNRLKSTN